MSQRARPGPEEVRVGALARAYVVDDEPLAVQRLTDMLVASGRVEVVGATGDPEEALALLSDPTRRVDVVFLDIEMPAMSGLQLARRMSPGPRIVFVTAHDSFALEAFEVSAVDYLLKPVRAAALERALDRIRREPGPDRIERIADILAKLEGMHAPPPADRIASRVGNRILYIELSRVTHFVAEDKLTCAVTENGTYVVDASISALEPKLRRARFVRIHRSTLVNLAYVGELHGGRPGNSASVRLRDAKRTQLDVSRDRVRELKDHLSL
jgi:two-component system LytT family response regulator